MKRRTAFTMVELLTVITIIALLAAIVVPSLGRAKELARRRVCLGNVRAIIVGLRSYATSDERGHFPSDSPHIDGTCYIGASQGLQSDNLDRGPGDDDPPDPAEITANAGTSRSLFLLVRGDHVGLKAFICPSTENEVNDNTDPDDHYDFATHNDLSYSYQVQKVGGDRGFHTSLLDEPDLIVLADRNPISGLDSWSALGDPPVDPSDPLPAGDKSEPDADATHVSRGGADEYMRNSFNHQQEGQIVGFLSGTAAFARNPKVGMFNVDNDDLDNIWCWQAADGTDEISAGGFQTMYPKRYLRHERQRDSFLCP